MIRESDIKKAFLEGRETDTDWEDSLSKIVNEISSPLTKLGEQAKFQRVMDDGRFGPVIIGVKGLKKYYESKNKKFHSENFKYALLSKTRHQDMRWRIL